MPLLALLKILEKNLDVRNIGCGTCVDLKKAFDTAEHDIFLSKPEHYGIWGVVIGWFKSFLSDRAKNASVKGCWHFYQNTTISGFHKTLSIVFLFNNHVWY